MPPLPDQIQQRPGHPLALGVAPDGQKRLLSLRPAVSEASVHWGSLVEDLQARGLPAPRLTVSDGHKGLAKALEKWPESRLQRCVQHKSANLLEHCPAHARRELKRDYNRIVWAKDGIEARRAYAEFVAKWDALAPAVVRSLEEAGEQLLTFYEFPRAMWKRSERRTPWRTLIASSAVGPRRRRHSPPRRPRSRCCSGSLPLARSDYAVSTAISSSPMSLPEARSPLDLIPS